MASKNEPTILHPDLLTSATGNLNQMITYYKVITFEPDPCTNLTISTPPPCTHLKINVKILTPQPPPDIGCHLPCTIPTVLVSRKEYQHVSSGKTEDSINKNLILEIIEYWQPTPPVKEDLLHITLQLYGDDTPKTQLNTIKSPKLWK